MTHTTSPSVQCRYSLVGLSRLGRVAGDRESVRPMAARDGAVSYDQLHHFIADGVWDSAPLEATLSGLRRDMPLRRARPRIASRWCR